MVIIHFCQKMLKKVYSKSGRVQSGRSKELKLDGEKGHETPKVNGPEIDKVDGQKSKNWTFKWPVS